MNVFIATPAYNSMVHTDFLHSIIGFYQAGLEFSVCTIGNESLVCRGRDTLISYFYNMKNFDYLLFLDADIFLHPDNLVKLIEHEKDVIGAPVALKGTDKDGNQVYNVGKKIKDLGDGLVTTDRIGTAVFMLSRKAVDTLVENAIENNDVYKSNPHTRGDAVQMDIYNVFKVGVKDGVYLSEDFYVCETLINLGFKVFVDTTVNTRHNGMMPIE